VILVAGCGGSDPTGIHGVSNNSTPGSDPEAELAAIWLSGELAAPQALYETIRNDLATIRHGYGESVPATSIEFHPQYAPSQLIVGFTPEAAAKIDDGGFGRLPEVQELNRRFGLTDFARSYGWDYSHWAVLTFSGCWNPERLGEIYSQLHDIEWAEPNWRVGDWSNAYPWTIEGGMSYLFREASGDCPAGCINSTFWYFRVISGDAEYVGTYGWGYDVDPMPEPEWWDEAKRAYEAYRRF